MFILKIDFLVRRRSCNRARNDSEISAINMFYASQIYSILEQEKTKLWRGIKTAPFTINVVGGKTTCQDTSWSIGHPVGEIDGKLGVDHAKLPYPTDGKSVRSLSVEASGLAPADGIVQLPLYSEMQKVQRRADINQALDKIRRKYGYHSIRRSIALVAPALDLDAKEEHIIHPISFLGTLHEFCPESRRCPSLGGRIENPSNYIPPRDEQWKSAPIPVIVELFCCRFSADALNL